MTELPHVPSRLIRLALNDLRKTESTPGYRINMEVWHAPSLRASGDTPPCVVCLAGAVMANSLSAAFGGFVNPRHYAPPIRDALYFLDMIRDADNRPRLKVACRLIGAAPIEWSRHIPNYSNDRVGFFDALEALADAFEASGQ